MDQGIIESLKRFYKKSPLCDFLRLIPRLMKHNDDFMKSVNVHKVCKFVSGAWIDLSSNTLACSKREYRKITVIFLLEMSKPRLFKN